MEDITIHTELQRLVAAVPWNVGMDCRMLLGIDAVQSVRHKVVVSHGQQTFSEYSTMGYCIIVYVHSALFCIYS